MNPGFDEQWLHKVLELLRSEVEPRLLPLVQFCLEHPRDRLSVEDLARRFRAYRRALEYRLARAHRGGGWALKIACDRDSRDSKAVGRNAQFSWRHGPGSVTLDKV
jgi:hypothetical protein